MTEASSSSGTVTLFPHDPQRKPIYRIPALLFIPPDTFLAFAEERSSLKDEHAKYLVLRRGRMKRDVVEWGHMEPLMGARKDGYRTMNPCPVYERETKTVFLFFICVEGKVTEQAQIQKKKNAARLCYIRSTDAGQTWSSLMDLTDPVIGKDVENWATFAVGPGHGVQLNSGRLVIPAYVYYITNQTPCCETQRCAFIFYSNDKGENWHKGELIRNVETEKCLGSKCKKIETLECQVAEVMHQSGDTVEYSLYCNARAPSQSTCRFRAEAFSTDQGSKFTSPSLCKKLCETGDGCQGSVVSFTPTLESYKSTSSCLLYSHPTDKQERKDLGIYLKAKACSSKANWKCPWVLNKGPSGYSDLAVCQGPPLLFGCLFECGVADYREKIAFQLFTEEDLHNNIGSSSCCCLLPGCC